MDRKGRPEWKYKEWAINRSGDLLREALPQDWLESATIVPVPTSKAKTDPRYDDRLIRVLRRLGAAINLDVRELVILYRTPALRLHMKPRIDPDQPT